LDASSVVTNVSTSLDVLLLSLCRRGLNWFSVSQAWILQYAQRSSSFVQFLMGMDQIASALKM
jgi:hypothetical protein